MQVLPLYQVAAFADASFTGNPAAVVPLQSWLPDHVMQSIALENQLSETAFFVPRGEEFDLRWFTPGAEVDLCGHATLATAFVIHQHVAPARDPLVFHTRSGELTVTFDRDLLRMDFPAIETMDASAASDDVVTILAMLPSPPERVLRNERATIVVWDDPALVRSFVPDFAAIGGLTRPYLSVTAPGEPTSDIDFVSRFFAPAVGVPEDPVTGSNHCALAPYWAQRLGRDRLMAEQASPRGGRVLCEVSGDRVTLAGRCVPYLEGHIHV